MNRACVFIAAIVAAGALALPGAGAWAQQATPPAVSSSETAVEAAPQSSYLPRRKQVYDMVILGDVLGTGLWAGMNRVVEADERITVTGRIQENSGLTRSRVYDWPQATAKLLESRPFDIAAIMLGANDARDIAAAEGDLAFGSAEWRNAYAAQIRALVEVLRANSVAVYWFGVPPMERESYDEAMAVVAEVERQVTAELGVRHIDLRLMLLGPDGKYTDTGDDGTGEETRLRSRDGVKFITRGNDRLAAELMKLVRADMAVADGAPAPAVVVSTPGITLTPEQLAALPAFVAERADGEEPSAIDPAGLPGPDYVELASVAPGKADASDARKAFEAARKATEPGSAAHRLFVDGLWPDMEKGAADPFTAPLPEGREP
jgi:hypothetical protein